MHQTGASSGVCAGPSPTHFGRFILDCIDLYRSDTRLISKRMRIFTDTAGPITQRKCSFHCLTKSLWFNKLSSRVETYTCSAAGLYARASLSSLTRGPALEGQLQRVRSRLHQQNLSEQYTCSVSLIIRRDIVRGFHRLKFMNCS